MHNPGEAAGSNPSPQELIAGLELNVLYALSNTLNGPWMRAVRTERFGCERSLESLRTYRPAEFETPAYDGPEVYISAARATNLTPQQLSDNIKMQSETKAAHERAQDYLAGPDTLHRLSSVVQKVDRDDLGLFFASNLYGVIGTARSVALRSFESRRNAVLRQRFPGLELVSREYLETSARTLPITAAQIEAAREEISALSSAPAPYPDFFQLRADQQDDIVQALGSEWEALCLLLHQADPKALTMHVTHLAAPLAYLPASTLREALEVNPGVDPAKICFAFLRTPAEFQKQVARLKVQAAAADLLRREAQRRAAERAGTPVPAEAEELSAEIEFMRYDHARIAVNERDFYLPIEQPNSLLAARVLHALAQAGSKPHVEGRAIARTIWSEMPPTERVLFINRVSDLQRKSGVIDAGVLDILRRLTNRMGITRETSNERFKLERRSTVSLELVPPAEADLPGLIPIFPPGTLREKIYEFAGDTIPDEALATANDVLIDTLYGHSPLSQSQALDLLSFITARNGKRALRARLEDMGSDLTLESALEHLHGRIRSILGEAYASAYKSRMIAGNIATGQYKVRQISGRLPITTKSLPAVVKRWYFGDSRFA
jgi:hypothetical protein